MRRMSMTARDGENGKCNAKMREMCPACVRWLNYREAAYQEHLRWMEEHARWRDEHEIDK